MGVNYFRRDGRDSKFVLLEHLDVERLLSYAPYQDFSADEFVMIIDEALKMGKEVLGPALQDGDRIGCTYEGGKVSIPDAFKKCWRVLNENG